MNLKEATELRRKVVRTEHALPKLVHPELVWHCGYYDGPLDGMCLHEGKQHWFQMVDAIYVTVNVESYRPLEPDDYNYTLIGINVIAEISEEQLKEEEYWQALFEKHVGTHTRYDKRGLRNVGQVQPQSEWPKYYDVAAKERPKRNFDNNKVVGYYFSHEFDLVKLLQEAE